jgi:DNA-binding CsgD family transcriptional regulator
LADSEFGRDFLFPIRCFHIIGAYLGSQGDEVSGIGFHRQTGDRPFGEREKEITNMILPHISRALHNMYLVDTIASSLEVGMIILREDGHITYINETAKKILAGRHVSVIPDPNFSTGSVFFRDKTGTYNVKTIKKSCTGQKEKIILLEPLPSESCIRLKLTNFGLTQRQEDIAILAVRGLSNREIGERLLIMEQTVKDHLHDIFEKLQIKSRTELTAKTLGIKG